MTKALPPPRLTEQIHTTKSRVYNLERRLGEDPPRIPPYIAKWSLGGLLFESESSPEMHPTSGRLQMLWATLTTAGTTKTVLRLKKNGSVVDTMNIMEGMQRAELVVSVDAIGKSDRLTIQIVEAGTGAAGLTVFGEFDV